MRHASCLAVVLASVLPVCLGQSVELLPAADNTLYQYLGGGYSNGAGPHFFVGRTNSQGGYAARRGLLRFDVASALPSGAVVSSAVLTLTCTSNNGNPTIVTIHRVTQLWGEGTSDAGPSGGVGALATPGDATWTHAMHPSAPWTNVGGDYDPTAITDFAVLAAGVYVVGPAPAFTAAVGGQLANPAENFGWLLRTDETPGVAKRFGTRENPGFEPRLAVSFLPAVPASVTIHGLGCVAPTATLPFAIAPQGLPFLGSVFSVLLTDGPPAVPAFLVASLGLSPSPIPVGGGCLIHLEPVTAIAWINSGLSPLATAALDSSGATTFALAIPPDQAFSGVVAGLQALAIAPGSPVGFVTSNAIAATLGH